MISMRQHAVSLTAVFLALAVGIVLGSGLLSNTLVSGLRDDKTGLGRELQDQHDRANALEAELTAADDFDTAMAGRIVRDELRDRSVLVITTPDTDPVALDSVTRTVDAAGGRLTGRLALTDTYLDAAGADMLRTTVTNVIPAGVQLDTAAVDPGSLTGDLLGAVLLDDPATGAPRSTDAERDLALSALRSGGFLTYEDGAVQPAQSVLVVVGAGPETDDGGNRGALVARLAAALDGRGAGTVLAGPAAAATGSGPVAVVRADAALSGAVSTVDNLDRESGRITTVLALREQLDGGSGRYGDGPGAVAVTVGSPAR